MSDLKRDHGGNLDAAIARFGGAREDWIDLSTGINPEPYPVPQVSADAWAVLPRRAELNALLSTAAKAYGTDARLTGFAGAQGAIQVIPFLRPPGAARVLAPTYNEHVAALRTGGWAVEEVAEIDQMYGADLAIVVNPNNPDGKSYGFEVLKALSERVGLLIVDESFADPVPSLSLAGRFGELSDNVVLLRSFGKFYGLAGIRLGFAISDEAIADRLSELAGPWPISGPAIEIATEALANRRWQLDAIERLNADASRLDILASQAGWSLVGGTPLFRTYATPDAAAAQNMLARHKIWSRIFPYSQSWIRLGLPPSDRWDQLEAAFKFLNPSSSCSKYAHPRQSKPL